MGLDFRAPFWFRSSKFLSNVLGITADRNMAAQKTPTFNY